MQQHHLQKPNNQQLELQTYQLQQQYLPQQQQQQQGYNFSTVSHEYNQQQQQQQNYSYKKQGSGFSETSSILKKHREEVSELAKPQSSVFSIDTHHRQSEQQPKGISIQQQPLPEIPQQHHQSRNAPQELNASTLASSNFAANYRSLQRPVTNKQQSYSSGTTQRNRESRPAIPAKVNPPVLPPKNRSQQQLRAQQPLPAIPSQSYNYHQQQMHMHQQQQQRYDRERSRDRDKSFGRSYDDSHQYRTSSKQQQQQNFQTLPHHHHHPSTTFTNASTNTGTNRSNRKSESSKRGSRELLKQPFENYSATEL